MDFCPKRGCHDALEVVDKTIMTKAVNYVVDMDIEKFFDTVDHKWMMKCLEQRIADPGLLRLIGRFLKGRSNGRREISRDGQRHTTGRDNKPSVSQYIPSLRTRPVV